MPWLSIEAGDKTVADVKVTPAGENLFRLDEEPALFLAAQEESEVDSFPRFGDTVVAQQIDATTIRYVSVHARGPYRHFDFMLSRTVVASPELKAFLSLVVAEGGHWERHMEGLLLISLPNGSRLEPNAALGALSSGA